MVQVLADGHFGRELHRVAASGLKLRRRRCGDDVRVTSAAVLFPQMPFDDEAPLHHRHHFRFLVLTRHLAVAHRALFLCLGEFDYFVDHGKMRLFARAVPFLLVSF